MELKGKEILILGAGWTSEFLIPLLDTEGISYAATTTTGRDGTLKFVFDPSTDSASDYEILPDAQTLVITFPLKGQGHSMHLINMYGKTHSHAPPPNYIQLGSTGIFSVPEQTQWVTRHSKYDMENERAVAEDELLSLGGCVLNLSGLWGGNRQPRNFVKRVADSKAKVKGKGALHMIHGQDVARAILGVHRDYTPKERWMLTDTFVYDWWALMLGWGGGGDQGRDKDAEGPYTDWVRELMVEEGIKALPRSMEQLGRCYDSREFWAHVKLAPVRARI